MKVITKAGLTAVSKTAFKRGFARQIGTDLIERLPDGAQFPILASAYHDRVQGQRGIPHMRTIIAVSTGETWQMDMEMDVFNDLPEID